MTKKLNEDRIQNELRNQSAFFPNEKKKRSFQRSNVPTDEPTEPRVIIRHTFDIYDDQLRELHSIQLKAVQSGKKKPKIGAMVRKAIDEFFENHAE